MFQSTRPRGARLLDYGIGSALDTVSIHAPRAGRDPVPHAALRPLTRFQSTRPVRGATMTVASGRRARTVSIHAPRAGRDSQLRSRDSAIA